MKKYVVSTAIATVLAMGHGVRVSAATDLIRFSMRRSATVRTAGCLLDASGAVTVKTFGPMEVMSVDVTGLPPNTEFDLFVIQLPNAPFGLSWYQGDIETNARGRGHGTFFGRFNIETFIVAPGTGIAPHIHDSDAASNPATAPVHTFHVGLWFNSPDDAMRAGCPGSVTPFNGDHTAGIQVLSTNQFSNTSGPLRSLH
jgi:hypothetical protein